MTVATFPFLGEAEAARSLLTGLEIESQLLDTHTIGMNALATIALGGIRLQVRRDRVEDARASLEPEVPFDEEALAAEAGAAGELPAPGRVADRRRTPRLVQVFAGLLLGLALLRVLASFF